MSRERRWPKYGILTPDVIREFRSSTTTPEPTTEASEPPKPRKRPKPPKNKRKRKRKGSVWAIPVAFESNRRKH